MSGEQVALYGVEGLTLGAQYGLIAMSLSLVYRMSAMVNFAVGDLAAVGALFGGVTLAGALGLPLGLALAGGMVAAGLLSMVVSFALLPPGQRAPGESTDDHTMTWVIAAVAASIVIQQLASLLWGSIEHRVSPLVSSGNVMFGDIPVRAPAIVLIGAAIAVALALDYALRRTRWGVRVRAAGADAVGAAVAGIDFRAVYLQVFAIGGLIAGLTGMLVAPLTAASPFIGFALTIKAFIAGALGGLGSIRGAFVGGFVLGLLESYAGGTLGAEWQDLVALGVLILVLVVRPTGIMPNRVRRAV